MKNPNRKLLLYVGICTLLALFCGACLSFYPFVGDDLIVREIQYCTFVICMVIAACTVNLKKKPYIENPIEDEDGSDKDAGQLPDVEIDDAVILLVFGGADVSETQAGQDMEYTLSAEDAEAMFHLFYSHEKEVLDSPVESIATLEFQIGEDYLNTSMGAIKTLSGKVGGQLVMIRLSESECDEVYQIISRYVPDVSALA